MKVLRSVLILFSIALVACNDPAVEVGFFQLSVKKNALPKTHDANEAKAYVVELENESGEKVLAGRELNIVSMNSDSLATGKYELDPGKYTLKSCRIFNAENGGLFEAKTTEDNPAHLPTEFVIKTDETILISPLF